jgi:hypothetical protein
VGDAVYLQHIVKPTAAPSAPESSPAESEKPAEDVQKNN